MATPVTAEAFAHLDLADWRVLGNGVEANFECGSFSEAGRFAADLAAICDKADHHASIDLRYPDLVHVMSTTHYIGSLSDRDVSLAQEISAVATERGYHSNPKDSVVVEVAIDALDIDAVRPFWQAVLGYVAEKTPEGQQVDAIYDPEGVGPAFWFQQMTEQREQRNRVHLDVLVPHDVAEERVEAALAHGGRLVDDSHAKAFWVLADIEGNEACVCTWQDRDKDE